MSEIDGPHRIGGPRRVDAVRAGRAEAPEAAGAIEAGAEPEAADPLLAVFDQVAERVRAGELTDAESAVRAAVEAVLDDSMGDLDPATRARLTEQVTAVVADHPEMRARLDRLLGT